MNTGESSTPRDVYRMTPRVIIERAKSQMRVSSLQACRTIRENFRKSNADVGRLMRDHFLDSFTVPAGALVAGYWPCDDEADCMPLVHALHDRGHRIAMPVVMNQQLPLRFRVWDPEVQMVPGRFGIPVPPDSLPEVVPDLLLVPLVAFDRRGNRLGRGVGYYDRTLAQLRAQRRVMAVGVAYAGQEVSDVPVDVHDQKLDWVLTEVRAMMIQSGVHPQRVFEALRARQVVGAE